MVEVKFEVEKETKNTYRFKEVEEGGYAKVGTIYVPKVTLAQMGAFDPAKGIKVTIESL